MSCGCVRTKHSGKGTRLYRIWTGMKDRCLNPRSKYRSNYGGRGITVCSAWADDFSVFKAWAIENGYADSLEIDRTNVNGDYCPENCRWITRIENSRNRRCSKLDLLKAKEIKALIKKGMKAAVIASKYGISRRTVEDIANSKIWIDA